MLPEIELFIVNSLGYTISIFGRSLPDDHDLYGNNFRFVTKITFTDLIKVLEKSYIFPGVKPTERCHDLLPHIIPKVSGKFHFAQLFYEDEDNALKILPKLTQDHIKLNS